MKRDLIIIHLLTHSDCELVKSEGKFGFKEGNTICGPYNTGMAAIRACGNQFPGVINAIKEILKHERRSVKRRAYERASSAK